MIAVLASAFFARQPPAQQSVTLLLQRFRHNGPAFAVLVLSIVVVAPAFEELFFRGVLLQALRTRVPDAVAVLSQAIMFGLLHLAGLGGGPRAQVVVIISASGVVFGWAALRFKSLGPGMVAHFLNNLLVVAVVSATAPTVPTACTIATSRPTRERILTIATTTMMPTLAPGDRVLVRADVRITRGAIVVFDVACTAKPGAVSLPFGPRSQRSTLGRIVGLPGDIGGQYGVVFLGGKPLSEPYLPHRTSTTEFGALTLEPGQVWVMNDNRSDTHDSREYGPISTANIVGVAVDLVTPSGRLHKL
jgi:signal peptidase I